MQLASSPVRLASPPIAEFGWKEGKSAHYDFLHPLIVDLVLGTGARSALDAGCGKGVLAARLARAGLEVTGLDADATGIRFARLLDTPARFHIGTFDQAPPKQFDLVCSTEVIEHLYNPDALVAFCHKALKPGGTLVISTPYHGYLKNLAISLTGGWDRHWEVRRHGGHIKFFSRQSLSAMLERHGFKVTEFRGAGRLPLLWKGMVLVGEKSV
jgi:2-polyprenyl-3-methyl-5-hydroxy-6-metoxy-1,4-benzoquinol methylase